MTWNTPIANTIENHGARLRLITAQDRDAFERLVFFPKIWEHFVSRVDTQEELDTFIASAVDDNAVGRRAAYAVIDKASGNIAGSMSYGNLAPADRRLEIGWSWLSPDYQGTGLNGWAKLALLSQAFDDMGAERVEFKTDVLNTPARRALIKIGATEEGVLRSFNYMPGGRRRNAIFYSVLRAEWADVRRKLEEKLCVPA